jgi:hypothetical protein
VHRSHRIERFQDEEIEGSVGYVSLFVFHVDSLHEEYAATCSEST